MAEDKEILEDIQPPEDVVDAEIVEDAGLGQEQSKPKPKHKGMENLKPFYKGQYTAEQRSEFSRHGGISSQLLRKEKKLLKEIAIDFLMREMSNGKIVAENFMEKIGLLVFSDRAKLGDVLKAFEVLRDTAGQSPTIKQEISGANGGPCVQKVFVTAEERKEVTDHIDRIIGKSESK